MCGIDEALVHLGEKINMSGCHTAEKCHEQEEDRARALEEQDGRSAEVSPEEELDRHYGGKIEVHRIRARK